MKKIFSLSIVIFVSLGLYSQTIDKKSGIGAGLGAYGALSESGIGLMPELFLGTYLSPKLDLMLKGKLGVYNSALTSQVDLANAYLNLRYKLNDESKKFRPYLYGGPGFLADNSETGLSFDLGLGGKYYFKPQTALYIDAGYIHGIETIRATKAVRDNIWKLTAGIEYDFGKTLDSDMDGVSDNKDKCPNTPTGVAVDANGCPVDSDGDGVADYIDDCPAIKGLTSLKGCPDSDKDGIADKDDDCPDVPGLAMLKGCPDFDGDGVADKNDKCPSTPKGYKVDETGCPLDTDKDGIVDDEDDCPTVFGIKENKGCPKKELTAGELEAQKMKVAPVYFDYDKANYIVAEKAKIEQLVKLLNENSDYKVNITGHTDDRGEDNYNMNLSKNRINSVVKTILASKIKKDRIASQTPMGETKPVATNTTDEGKALNRRVEFELFKTK